MTKTHTVPAVATALSPAGAIPINSTPPLVSARNLTKRLGGKEILHGLDFDIPPGRIYGLVGHNGAGKTTTLNALLGLTTCQGQISVLGKDPFAHRAALMRDVAFISDVASLPRFLAVRELFALMTDIHPNFSSEAATALLKGTDVRPQTRIGHLSKGMIAQVHLAAVMAINARLLVLDEPTLGLDITFRKCFYKTLVDEYMTPDRTLLITTHQVDEIEFMLTDIMFIRDGHLILHTAMAGVAERFVQLLANPEQVDVASALGPVYAETRFGQTAMIFDGVERDRLAPLGSVSTPALSDLFVALMQHEPANTGALK